MGKVIDITGQRFGKLVVIQRADDHYEPSGKRVIRWKCQCDCGEISVVSGSQLRKGRTKSCGCLDHPDINGKRFGKLTVIREGDKKVKPCGSPVKMWICKCDCGNTTLVSTSDLNNGHTTSCGCVKRGMLGNITRKHGMTKTRIYKIYRGMISRCYSKSNPHYDLWGGRGIKICDEWLGEHGFENFMEWSMNNGYENGLSIDRIDNNGNYEPLNCRWTTWIVQANNTRKNIYVTYKGKTQSLPDWCRELGLEYNMIYLRYKRGWDTEKMFNQPKRKW